MNPSLAPRSQRAAAAAPDTASPARGWIVLLVIALLLALGSWRGYAWLVQDVEHRRAVAEGRAPDPVARPVDPHAPQAAVTPINPPRTTPATRGQGEPLPPAVRGDAVRRCVRGDEVVFTNQPCAPGFEEGQGAELRGDPSEGVTPVGATSPTESTAKADVTQQAALCRYLASELERLDFEFHQPLPPPVLDLISSHLSRLRAQAKQIECAPVTSRADARGKSDKPSAERTKGARP